MTEYIGPPVPDEDPDQISEEDILGRIEESFEQDTKVEREIPGGELDKVKHFLECFNVKGAEEIADEQLEDIWYRLTRDPSIGPEYSYMPGIYPGVLKDFAYLLTDFNTKLNLSALPMPIEVHDFIRHAKEIETRDFSPRMWMIEHKAVPNLAALGMDPHEVFNSADGDKDGLIRLAEVTRFLGWLVDQDFLKHGMKEELDDFMKKNSFEEVTLTRIASVAIKGVMDKQEELEKSKRIYQTGYPIHPVAVARYDDVMHALSGIRNWAEELVLGAPSQT
jgi:hypothetical protein